MRHALCLLIVLAGAGSAQWRHFDEGRQAVAPSGLARGMLAAHNSVRARAGVAPLLWSDRLARGLILAGLALNALFFGYMSLVYQGLPPSLPLHWNAQAQVDAVGDPLLTLADSAPKLLALTHIYGRERRSP